MYAALIKKVNVSKSERLTRMATNKATNFIGIGGTNGFVQIVNLDVTKNKEQGNQLSFTQTLEYHSDDITIVCWNDVYNKLTTCDKNGVIIVWKTIEGKWETEMINNREQSYVTDIKWNKQGSYLCFIYEDGHAIVGTVEGNRSWGNDIRNSLYLVEWSPDGNLILLASRNSNLIILSASGQQLGEVIIPPTLKEVELASIEWWSKYIDDTKSITLNKHLMLSFKDGSIALYDDQNDMEPIIFKTNIKVLYEAEWNGNGDLIALCGLQKESETKAVVSFYSSNSEFLKLIKIPENICCINWDAKGTKIAVETQNTIYFGLVKPKYKWCYFSDTLVYSYLSEQDHHTVAFWNTKINTFNYKYVKNMLDITAFSSFCLVTAKVDKKQQYLLILSNSIGSPVDNKIVNIEPLLIAINGTHVVVTNKHYIYVWQFRGNDLEQMNSKNLNTDKTIIMKGQEISINLLTQKMMKENCFFIDETPNMKEIYNINTFKPSKKTNDPISAIALSDNHLFIACESGKALKYNLLSLSTIEKYYLAEKMFKIGLSPNAQYLWTLNDNNILNIWDTTKDNKKYKGEKLKFEKKDVWDIIWENNNNNNSENEDQLNFAFLEKNKLNIMKNLEPEEIITCNGYLAQFCDLNIIAINLDDLMFHPEIHELDEVFIKIETRTLRELRTLIDANTPAEELLKFVNENPSKKCWDIVARHCLYNLDFIGAEKCFLHLNDYMGLEFIKRIKNIDDDNLKKAEVNQFYEDYDQAENEYSANDRKDLAIAMRFKLGQWDKVISLMQDSGVVKEDHIKASYSNHATQFFEDKDYDLAEENYKKAGDIQGLINVWFRTEEFDKAANYIDKIPDENEFLLTMGKMFETYGLCDEAVKCYLKFGDVKKAIDTCVLMNKWNLAVELAEKNNFFQIEGIINKFGSILMEKGKKMDLVELYRKAHRHSDAAKILINIAEDLKSLNASPITLKKIYTVAALEMESFKSRLIDAQITNITTQTVQNTTTLDTLITSDLSNVNDKTLNNPWKGAEAYHFYMLCQTQLYEQKYPEALKTALRLALYEKELGAKEVYQLIALAGYLNHCYKECSKALSTLEQLPDLTKAQKQNFKDLAVGIFTKHEPRNKKEQFYTCPKKNCGSKVSEFAIDCKVCGSNFSPCVVSGQSIFAKGYYKCKRCKHKSLEVEVLKKAIRNCALCHLPLDLSQTMSGQDDY